MISTESPTIPRATLIELAKAEGKAELIGGRVVVLTASGYRPNLVAAEIYWSLAEYAERTGRGVAFTDNVGYAVPELSSGRESFSPDASFYVGPPPADEMDFIAGPPTLAVEVRSKGEVGPAAEAAMAAKRNDYFEAGTLVVWDVDTRARLIRVFRCHSPLGPVVVGKGKAAEAEPAVVGWRLDIDRLFAC